MTIDDIAKITGYSAMTVSRAINQPEKVRASTRKAILDKVAEFGYTPNTAAKSLATNKTYIIYVYIPADLGVDHPFVMQVVAAIGERLGENGYSFYLSRKPYSGESCDGIIAMGMTLEEEAKLTAEEGGKPCVFFGNSATLKNWVDVDNFEGSYSISKYVIDKGYDKIAYIGINQSKRYADDRRTAFEKAMSSAGLTPVAVANVDNKENAGYEATKELLKEVCPQVIICASDLLAIGCIRALRSSGLKVPSDVAVTGYDGLGYETLTYPHITTVKQPIYSVGLTLTDMLLNLLKKGETPDKGVYIKPELELNESA